MKKTVISSLKILLFLMFSIFISSCSSPESLYEDGMEEYNDGEFEDALEKFEKAAKKNNSKAMLMLGSMYKDGKGVTQSYDNSIIWYERAEQKGENITKKLNELYKEYAKIHEQTKSYEKALSLFSKASYRNDFEATNKIGEYYQYGKGVSYNYETAFKYYEKAADGGNLKASRNIGYLYYYGFGVTQDYKKAAEYYQKAFSD